MFQQLIDVVDAGVDQLTALVLRLGGSWVGQPTRFPLYSLPTRASTPALPWLIHPNGAWEIDMNM